MILLIYVNTIIKLKKLTNLIHENFNLEDSNKSIFNEGDYSFYCEKISQILRA